MEQILFFLQNDVHWRDLYLLLRPDFQSDKCAGDLLFKTMASFKSFI